MCEGSEYIYHGDTLRAGGEYQYHLTSINGCDSVVTLILTVHPIKNQTDYKTIFSGDSVEFYGEWYKASGIYEHKTSNLYGCEEYHQLILTVLEQTYVDTTASVCENELPFIWHGIEYNATGVYAVPTSWTDSSRVVTTLTLTVLPVPRNDRVVNICQGNTFTYKGRDYTENCIFFDTIPSKVGCDSIIKYIIRVHPTFDRTDTVHISDKQTFVFNGRVLTKEGDYVFSDTTQYGCDSIHHLHLVVHPSYFFSEYLKICKPDTIEWHDRLLYESGTYTDSLLTDKYGFDSVYQIVVEAHESYFLNEQFEIGEGEVLKIHGRDISAPAIYFDTLRTQHGCDSIFHIVVNPKRTREFTWTREICQGDYYEFLDGRKLTHTGQYKYVSQYKDSIVTLNLTVNPISINEKRILITNKQVPYVYNGKIYKEGGVYNDTLVNKYGCDSICRLILTVSSHYSEWTPMPLCPGSELKIDGEVITEAGLYSFERRSYVTGEMDSIFRVEVYDAPAFEFDMDYTMCEGDTLFFNDSAIAVSRGGLHDIRLKTKEGCDSIYHLNLTVWPSYHFITDTTITDYQSVEWRGRTYFESGDYDRSWPTIHNCDSTYTLSLHVVPTKRDTTFATICTGQEYTWRGRTYDKDGLYNDTTWLPDARFSAIYSLRLVVAYPTHIANARIGDICADAESFDIYFDYIGQKPTHYSVFFDVMAKREGFEDIIDAPLYGEMVAHINLPQFNAIAYETHPYYVRPDYYTMHLALDNGVCGVSRSDSITLLIKYPSWIIEQNWSDIVVPLKSAYNGGFEFAQIEWYVNGVVQPEATGGYLYSTGLIKGDQVVMSATRKGENYAIPTCPLVITDPQTTTYDEPVIVYPTQTPRMMPVITVSAPQEGSYEVYSTTGTVITSGSLNEGETQITLPSINGIYFIRARQGDETTSHKVILY
jgi:hypothetical protein